MKRYAVPTIIIFLLMVFPAGQARAELFNRAPDVLPGTIPEMRDAGWWMQRMDNPDEVLLSETAIIAMNERYSAFAHRPDPLATLTEQEQPDLSAWWPGWMFKLTDFTTLEPQALADTVRTRIGIQIDFLRSRPFGNYLAIEYPPETIDRFEAEMALDEVPDEAELRHGMAVRCTRLRNVPTFAPREPGLTDNLRTRWDWFNFALVKIGEPVGVLHVSRSGEYLLVKSDAGIGWVRAEDIAFADRERIERYVSADDFVVCTGDRVQFYADRECTLASGWFAMGDRLPLAEPDNPRLVRVPMRRMNGELAFETAWLKPGDRFNRGLLPFTRRNIVETAFRLLDLPYDWTGSYFSRMHDTNLRDLFACFGFDLPRHGGMFHLYGDNREPLSPEVGTDRQHEVILGREPFVTIMVSRAHSLLLLGGYDGRPIVFDTHGYGYTADDGEYYYIRRCSVGDLHMPDYFLENPVRFLELK